MANLMKDLKFASRVNLKALAHCAGPERNKQDCERVS